jgi:outer membrane protein assembly factor BamB
LWQYRVEAAGPLPGVHDKHNLASPSPITDGQMVYAWFGTGQIVALDMNGKSGLAAQSRQGDFAVRHQLGAQQLADACFRFADPVVRSRAGAYLLAVDKRTGKDRWKAIAGADACPTRRRSSSRPTPGRS